MISQKRKRKPRGERDTVDIVCKFCGDVFKVERWRTHQPPTYKAKFCSVDCKNDSQRTGSIDKHGYVLIHKDGVAYREHRLIMETIIGRKLRRYETVHHRNGNRADNKEQNLELWSGRHAKGVRIRDLREYLMTIPKRLGGLK